MAVPLAYAETVLKTRCFYAATQPLSREKMLQRVDHFTTNQTYELSYRLAELLLVAANHEDVYKEKHTEIAEYLGLVIAILFIPSNNFESAALFKNKELLITSTA